MVATAPAIGSLGTAFIASGGEEYGEAVAGDHLQSVYRFWLVGHGLENGEAPWSDPYSFQPLAEPQTILAGWPFGIPFWPLEAAFGPVVAWNLLLLAGITLAGLVTYGWLRSLALSPFAAGLGGLAFAIAPYRLAQSAGHLLGWVAIFLPLALWAFERSRVAASPLRASGWGLLSAVALVSIPLSGQVHLALGVLPFVLVYAAVRFRPLPFAWLLVGIGASAAVGLLIKDSLIDDSAASQGRTLAQVEMFQASWLDLFDRFGDPAKEQFVYVGWLTLALGVAGVVLLARRKPWLAALLAVALVIPLLLAVGTHLPSYEPLWRNLPPFRFPRVPARLLPVADLALAALVAFAAAWGAQRLHGSWRRVAGALAVVLVAADLLVFPFRATAADPGNAAYAALDRRPPGRMLALPLFEPGIHFGSIYQYYTQQAHRETPGGYSTLAPTLPYSFFWSMNRVNCGFWFERDLDRLRGLGIRYLVYHAGAYRQAMRAGAWFNWRALQELGLRATAGNGSVWLIPLDAGAGPPQPPPVEEPPRSAPVLCEGWRGWTMKQRQAPFWIYGSGRIELVVTAPEPTRAYLWQGDSYTPYSVRGRTKIEVDLPGERWHRLMFQVPELFLTTPPQGLELREIRHDQRS